MRSRSSCQRRHPPIDTSSGVSGAGHWRGCGLVRLWHRRRVLEAKPGITGLWQVNGRSRIKFDDMVRLDLRYAKTWSPWMDLKILLRTPVAVVFGDGAY